MILNRVRNKLRKNKIVHKIYQLYKQALKTFREEVMHKGYRLIKKNNIRHVTHEMPCIKPHNIIGKALFVDKQDLINEGGLRTHGVYRTVKKIPLVTIITVVFNCASKLERAILSVLAQTYQNIEYIIIDGGSTDGCLEIINKYADKIDYFISQPDKGIYDAMNKGLALSQGDFIGIVNADDMMLFDGVFNAVAELLKYRADYVAAQDYCVDENGVFVMEYEVSHIDERCLVSKNPCNHGAMLIGKNVYNKIGYYDTKYLYAADYKFQAQICIDKEFVGCKLLKNIHYFEMAGVSIKQREKSLEDVCNILIELVPGINKKHVKSLVYFMHEKEWNEEIKSDLECIIKSGVYNELQIDYLISEMKKAGMPS